MWICLKNTMYAFPHKNSSFHSSSLPYWLWMWTSTATWSQCCTQHKTSCRTIKIDRLHQGFTSHPIQNTRCANKNNHLTKILYVHNYSQFFILNLSFYREECRPYMQQSLLQYLFSFKNYNYLNLMFPSKQLTAKEEWSPNAPHLYPVELSCIGLSCMGRNARMLSGIQATDFS